MKQFILKYISRLPMFVNRMLLKINNKPEVIYGKEYHKNYGLLLHNSSVQSPDQLLLKTVNKAIKEVPYYQKIYGNLELKSIREFEEKIGFIDKETVIKNFNDFLNPNENIKDNYDLQSTGGTTGQALKLYLPKNRQNFEVSSVHYLWAKIGYNFSKRAVIRNHKIPKNKVYRINPITKEFLFDGFRINDEYFMEVYKVLKANKIAFIHTFSYNAYVFAKFLVSKKLDTTFIQGFLTTSEMIYDYQTRFFDTHFPKKHYNFYGHTEKLIIGGFTKPSSNDYFFEPHYGYAELLDDKNHAITEVGKQGELVATGFLNPGMPLIRYKTDDFAIYKGNHCPETKKKGLYLSAILGRKAESIYNKDKTPVTTSGLNLHGDLLNYFECLQYVQKEYGELTINIVPSKIHTEKATKRLLNFFHDKFNEDMNITIHYLKDVPKQANGKFLLLKSEIKD